jgi:hypothetical protein
MISISQVFVSGSSFQIIISLSGLIGSTVLEINFFVIFLSSADISKENSSACGFSIETFAIQFSNFKILENFAVFEVDEISTSEDGLKSVIVLLFQSFAIIFNSKLFHISNSSFHKISKFIVSSLISFLISSFASSVLLLAI